MNTRRSIFMGLLMASAALFCLAGCNKDNGEKIMLGVGFEQVAGLQKTYVEGLRVLWSDKDQVNVNGTPYAVDNDAVEVGQSDNGYAAVYPADAELYGSGKHCTGGTVVIPATQTYIADANGVQQLNAPMAARLDSKTGRLLFRNLYAVIKVTVKAKSGEAFTLNSITVTSSENLAGTQKFNFNNKSTNEAAPTFGELSNPSQSVTLKFNTPQTISANQSKSYYLYVLPFTPSNITILLNDNLQDKKDRSGYTTRVNRSSLGSTIVDAANLKPNAIGTFTINADGSTVSFSPGNLYWNGSYFDFEANQWDYPNSWSANHVGHFYWKPFDDISYSCANSYTNTSISSSDVLFTNDQHFNVHGMAAGTWRSLTKNEWEYLLKTRKVNGHTSYCLATVNGIKGMIIFPDGWSDTKWPETSTSIIFGSENYAEFKDNNIDATQWSILEAKGCVLLPGAGYRENGKMNNSGNYGTYMSATTDGSNLYHTRFKDNDVYINSSFSSGDLSRCIRLVKDI